MDGVIVNSEPLWAQAEMEVFSALGVQLRPDLTQLTKNMTTAEVTDFWFKRFPWQHRNFKKVEMDVVLRVIELIKEEDCIIPGIKNFINRLSQKGRKIALATNSPYEVIPVVLEKAGIAQKVCAITSADMVERGKPEPDVYLKTIKKLNLLTSECLAVEDSASGIMAARKAGLKVAGFSNSGLNKIEHLSDFVLHSFLEADLSELHF